MVKKPSIDEDAQKATDAGRDRLVRRTAELQVETDRLSADPRATTNAARDSRRRAINTHSDNLTQHGKDLAAQHTPKPKAQSPKPKAQSPKPKA